LQKKKKKGDITLVSSPFSFQTKTKKQKKKWMASSSSQAKGEKKNTEKKDHREKKNMQRREEAYLSPASTFGMKHSSCILLSTFLQR